MPSEVSDQEIEREINTLKNLRRRSVTSAGPGALPLDPDLPPPSPTSRSPYSHEGSTSYSSNDDITLSTPDGLDGDEAGLFWVPAHLHPELAPGEFRAFLKSHTHPDPTHADAAEAGEAPGLSRSPSWVSRNPSRRGVEGLGRKRSMLSRQYQPKAGDNVEEERPPLPSRRPPSIYGGRSGEKGLTLEDLQKLEELVEEADEVDDDPNTMRTLLRRSLSMNVAPGFLQDDIPQGGDEADAPLVVPRPGSILRRSARTKIRKAGLQGDGGGHRFAATRKGRTTAAPHIEIPGLEDDDSSENAHYRPGSDENELEDTSADSHHDQYHDAVQHLEVRRGSDESTDETDIFDSYARESRSASMSSSSQDHSTSPSPESSPPGRKLSLPPVVTSGLLTTDPSEDWFRTDYDKTPTQETAIDPIKGLRRPSPGAEISGERPAIPLLSSGPTLQVPGLEGTVPQPSAPGSASQQRSAAQTDLPPGMAPPQRSSLPPSAAAPQQQGMTPVNLEKVALARTDSAVSTASSATSTSTLSKEKEKKGGFFSKKDKKDKEGKGKKDKDRFLGSLFGGSKKKQEEPPSSVANFSSAGPAAAAALLGSSKSARSLGHPPSPSPTQAGFNNFSRYPIHVERAVYRLSHIKLANARRPLYEQVLISNLMFWYLGIIGRNVTEEKKAGSSNADEKKEEAKPVVVKGTPPKPADTGSAGKLSPVNMNSPKSSSPAPAVVATSANVETLSPQPVSGKKTSLSKPERARDGRNNEAAVRTPQYGMQNAQVDHELRSGPAIKSSQQQQQQQQQPPLQQRPPMQSQHSTPPSQPQAYSQQPQIHRSSSQQFPPPQQQQQRSMSPNMPGRTISPPASGPGGRPPSGSGDMYQAHQPGVAHRDLQGPPRGLPQSSFGPPPPGGGGPPSPLDERRDPRQRTMSNPTHPLPPPGAGPNTPGMRRVVTDGRAPPELGGQPPRPLYPQHSGPQPGQLFQYPGAGGPPSQNGPASPFPPRPSVSAGPQPGQIFNPAMATGAPQPGQIFQHPQYGQQPSPQQGQRPLPPAGGGGWEPPQRLPPGAGPPQWAPGHARPPSLGPPAPGGPPYDPRRGPPPRPHPPPPNHHPQGHGPPTPYNAHQAFYGHPQVRPGQPIPGTGPGPQPGQVYNAHPAGAYGHHR
ncbi:hypothetical protein CI109_105722 [Kwoniella shandongensis]|uniref:Uncharacterized protein n=1 Tax=Kwoniella shandongensis TaxID=1734106 RepID=A0A5M6C1N7_9TREE|nr:uncharacterized protein CI109_003062 [Kwoniella shandongensis]KAA5528530.1 hypothetical protein CI109_003062 [Kwoniella shandongensis]